MNPISIKTFLILALPCYHIIDVLILILSLWRDRVHTLPSVFWETPQVLIFPINVFVLIHKKNFP